MAIETDVSNVNLLKIVATNDGVNNNNNHADWADAKLTPKPFEYEDIHPFGYCGKYYDAELDMVYLRNRYYSPSIGRFITEAPIKDGLNWYAYCGNNPISIENTEDGGTYVNYEGLKFYYPNINLTGAFLRAEIIDSTYTFGYKYIAVGDEKEKILEFYKYGKQLFDVPDNVIAYTHNGTIIYFLFDENNIVQKITLTWEL